MSPYGSAARNNPDDDAPAPDPRTAGADLAKADAVRPHRAHPDAAAGAAAGAPGPGSGPGSGPDPADPQAARPEASPERGAGAARFAVVPGADRAAERPSQPARAARSLPGPRPGDPQPAPAAPAAPAEAGSGGWLGVGRTQRLRAEWHSVQAGFVDDPRQAVQQADALIEKSVGLLTEAVTERRHQLRGAEAAPDGTPAASTEDLRLTLREYRSLLERLLGT
ncbi:hypothetical protein SAMN05216371_7284 [Streptomyces sp. TLI_053]|uniref:hypothetical protein n=1 Tax=Streptomyces sp. TLI_053 TaxID=1855352 RepID=UPI0008799330|nr:hypothetical protein [Streptomyces sp. TLI_053]SDT82496.1 hypothetical protein SAMN05216371_7284 [Streptomyces sp. TLI_053]